MNSVLGSPVQSTAEVGHGRDRVADVVLAQEQAEVVAELERGQLWSSKNQSHKNQIFVVFFQEL